MVKGSLKKFVKNNGFYLAIVLGIVALFGVVVATELRGYTDKEQVAENAVDFKDVAEDGNNQVAVNGQNNDAGLDYTDEYNADEVQNILNKIEEDKNKEETQDAVTTNTQNAGDPFDESKVLEWPVMGQIILDYTMESTTYYETLDQYKVNPSILIRSDVSEVVSAGYGGVVKSITDDTQLGTVVKIDMGNGYVASYGQLKDVIVSEGEVVIKGQTIASVAQPTKYFTREGCHLNFAVTKDEKPIDPNDILESQDE